jgi:hypothetical protein
VEPEGKAVARYQPGKHVTAVRDTHTTIEKERKRCLLCHLYRGHVTQTQRATGSCEVGTSPRGQEPWNPEAEDTVGSTPREDMDDLMCAIVRNEVRELGLAL